MFAKNYAFLKRKEKLMTHIITTACYQNVEYWLLVELDLYNNIMIISYGVY